MSIDVVVSISSSEETIIVNDLFRDAVLLGL